MIRYNLTADTANSSTSDSGLVRLAQEGNRDAFSGLYERYLPMVYKRVRYAVPERDVEDVTQDIFMAVLRSLKGFKGDALFSTWLRTLTKRRIADYYRRKNPAEHELDVDLGEADDLIGEADTSITGGNLDDAILIRKAMRSLPEDYQEIVLLRFAEGLQFNEIAQMRGQSLEATKSLFRRAISALRRQMGEPDA
jgi:RNA polymerase sigma-70 factor (ECF subfamily)